MYRSRIAPDCLDHAATVACGRCGSSEASSPECRDNARGPRAGVYRCVTMHLLTELVGEEAARDGGFRDPADDAVGAQGENGLAETIGRSARIPQRRGRIRRAPWRRSPIRGVLLEWPSTIREEVFGESKSGDPTPSCLLRILRRLGCVRCPGPGRSGRSVESLRANAAGAGGRAKPGHMPKSIDTLGNGSCISGQVAMQELGSARRSPQGRTVGRHAGRRLEVRDLSRADEGRGQPITGPHAGRTGARLRSSGGLCAGVRRRTRRSS